MTNRDKNLIQGFLKLSGLAKETTEREEKVFRMLSNLLESLPENKRKEGIILQSDLEDLIELIKWNYMGYGANLNEVLEVYNLDWTPAVADEINREVRKENVA